MTARHPTPSLPSDARRQLERASDPGRALAVAAENGTLSMTPILKALGIDPSNPTHQAALLVADKYGLDPILKHVIVIPGKGLYITRDGYLHIAHASGKLDGIEVVSETETDQHWLAKVAVYRADMSRPFTYTGRYPKNGGNKSYGPEMAIKTGEVMALRRAFNVAGLGAKEEAWDDDVPTVAVHASVVDPVVDAELVDLDPEQGNAA